MRSEKIGETTEAVTIADGPSASDMGDEQRKYFGILSECVGEKNYLIVDKNDEFCASKLGDLPLVISSTLGPTVLDHIPGFFLFVYSHKRRTMASLKESTGFQAGKKN